MKIIGIMGGLGSQMSKYAFYLYIKSIYLYEDCVIDISPYINDNAWNGYELERVFGIKANVLNIEESVLPQDHKSIIVNYFRKRNVLEIVWYRYGKRKVINIKDYTYFHRTFLEKIKWYGRYFILDRFVQGKMKYNKRFVEEKGNVYFDDFDHTSDIYFGSNRDLLRKVFVFPNFTDEKNISLGMKLINTESVAIHVRRSDHLYDCGKLFLNNYYCRAVDYIKRNRNNLFFCVFSEDIEWCKNNIKLLGLSDNDSYMIVDWNSGADSYNDMHLMTMCRNNILNYSIFSWWGYYLGNHRDKIVIGPQNRWNDSNVIGL